MTENNLKNGQYPKISIVTPSFNSAKYIEDCIQSVLNQNYPNFEHIIIDGGSTDGTIEILKKYPHLIWISEPDEGQSDALNKGFKMASGDIIGWLNSDDVYLQETFNKVINELNNSDVDGVYSNIYFGDKNLNITRKLITHKPIKWLSLFHCFIPSTSFFFKRKIIDNGILIDKNIHITMDKDFFARILYSGFKLKYVNDFWAIFRWHDANKSLDTREVKKIRYKEGLKTMITLTKSHIPVNQFTVNFYVLIIYLLKPYRKYLRAVSK
ncbi:glycosyltransferase family 2 protein [Ignavibacteria bacterium 4148-Me]|uniref:glycosyltransferase family 2 protein n=1 Tax=Rosettibacter primus TaxID=3111523 RepID=UPI00336BDC15